MGVPVVELVDLDRYPVVDTGGHAYKDLVGAARSPLTWTGAVELPGFFNPAAIAAPAADADALAPRARHSAGEGTA